MWILEFINITTCSEHIKKSYKKLPSDFPDKCTISHDDISDVNMGIHKIRLCIWILEQI